MINTYNLYPTYTTNQILETGLGSIGHGSGGYGFPPDVCDPIDEDASVPSMYDT